MSKKDIIDKFIDTKWEYISKDYDIPISRIQGKRRNEITPSIVYLLEQGYSNKEITDKIVNDFGLPDRRKVQLSVSDVKSRYFKVTPSTTIPNTMVVEKDPIDSKEEVHPEANAGT